MVKTGITWVSWFRAKHGRNPTEQDLLEALKEVGVEADADGVIHRADVDRAYEKLTAKVQR